MVHFLSTIFFLRFLDFLLGFSKVLVFLCHPVLLCVIAVLAFADCLVRLLLLPVLLYARYSRHSGTVESTRIVGHGALYISTQVPTFRRSLLYSVLE